MRRALAIGGAALLLGTAPAVAPTVQATAGPAVAMAAAAAPTPTVLTYNVRNCCTSEDDLLTGNKSWPHRRPMVIAVLAGTGADVIALQEANPYNKHGRSGTPTHYPAAEILAGLRQQKPGKDYALATTKNTARPIIYSRHSMSLQKLVVGGKTVSSAVLSGRMALLRDKASGKKFLVANMHLPVRYGSSASNSVTSEKHRREVLRANVRQVRTLAGALTGGRVVYLGDFNSAADRKLTGSGASKYRYAAGKLMKNANIPDGSTICQRCGTAKYATFNGFAPRNTGTATFDHIFVKNIAVYKWRVLHEVSYRASDHFPVKVELRF